MLQEFVHLHIAISQLAMTLDLLWKGPHIHISSVILVISMILMNVFVSPYSFDNITVIVAHFHNIIFCFKFYYPIVDIVNQLYLIFLRSRETNTKCCDKNVKTHSDIVLVWLVRSVARNIVYLKNVIF